MFVIFCGLPGTGKTTLSRALARRLGAVYLRVDTVERAILDATDLPSMNDAGYRVGYAVAEDNLRLGQTVIADSVNPLQVSRDAWTAVAERVGVPSVEVETICSDTAEHRRRVETRKADIAGLRQPTWQEVLAREFHAWTRPHVVIETAGRSIEDCLAEIEAALSSHRRRL